MKSRWYAGRVSLTLCLAFALAACESEDSTELVGSAGTGSVAAGGSGSEPPPCVENPVTHQEIINACSSYANVRKTPQLTLLNPDGTLPPL